VEGGEARALVAGEPFFHRRVWQAGSKYYQHAYSSSLGFALTGEGGPQLAAGRTGLSADGKTWAYRTWPRVLALDECGARSEWDAAVEGLTGSVVTESRLLDRGEVHVFWHTATAPRYLCLGGWALQVPGGQSLRTETGPQRVTLLSETMWSTLEVLALGEVEGEIIVEEVRPRAGFRQAHLLGGWAAYPWWRSRQPVAPGQAVAIFVDAACRGEARQPAQAPRRVRIEGGKVIVESDPA